MWTGIRGVGPLATAGFAGGMGIAEGFVTIPPSFALHCCAKASLESKFVGLSARSCVTAASISIRALSFC